MTVMISGCKVRVKSHLNEKIQVHAVTFISMVSYRQNKIVYFIKEIFNNVRWLYVKKNI